MLFYKNLILETGITIKKWYRPGDQIRGMGTNVEEARPTTPGGKASKQIELSDQKSSRSGSRPGVHGAPSWSSCCSIRATSVLIIDFS